MSATRISHDDGRKPIARRGYALGAGYQRWERSLTPIGIIVLVILLLMVGGSKILAARRQVREDVEQVESGPRHEREHEREAE